MKKLIVLLLIISSTLIAQSQVADQSDSMPPPPEMGFYSIENFKEYVREVRSKFMVAQAPIYQKGTNASPVEIDAYRIALIRLAEIQFYLGGQYDVETIHTRLFYAYITTSPSYVVVCKGEGLAGLALEVERKKIVAANGKCLFPQIRKFKPPFSREDLNAHSRICNAIRDLLSMNVALITEVQ